MRRGLEFAPFRYSLAANGCLITPEVVDSLLAAGMISIQVSIDGINAKQFSYLRKSPPDAFAKAWQAVRVCRSQGWPGCNISMFLHPGNLDSLPKMADLAKAEGPTLFCICGFIPVARGAKKNIKVQWPIATSRWPDLSTTLIAAPQLRLVST